MPRGACTARLPPAETRPVEVNVRPAVKSALPTALRGWAAAMARSPVASTVRLPAIAKPAPDRSAETPDEAPAIDPRLASATSPLTEMPELAPDTCATRAADPALP